jgi:hypothetical protein
MVILKLSRLIICLFLFSCLSKVDKEKCNTYINEGYGAKISFIRFKNLEVDSIKCFVQNKQVQKGNIKLWGSSDPDVEFFLHEQILLTDTIKIEYKEKKYKVYNFQNHINRAISRKTREMEDYCELNSYNINMIKDIDSNGAIVIDGSENY